VTDDPAWALAKHVCGVTLAAVPETARLAARHDILDTFGCLLGGSGAAGIAELAHVLGRWGGLAEAQVVLWPLRLPAPPAAMLNAAMAHALDFDDTLDHGGSIHPGASVLGAALAASDLIGGAGGDDVLLAVVLGLDVSCRIAVASTLDRGWHRTAAMGVFGAAAAAGKLLGLDAGQMLNAFGIAFSQAAGNRQCIIDGALTKRLQAGQAASSGVLAAVLAREGFTGAHGIFCGRFGFLPLYQPDGHDAARLTDGLGERFEGERISFKPYPCGRPQHAMLDAALAARSRLGLTSPEDLARIESVIVTADGSTVADNFVGAPHKRRPTQIVEAQFALPFLIAAALAHGRLGIGEVAGFGDAAVLALAERIAARPGSPAGIAVRLRDGSAVSVATTTALGAPENPLSIDQLRAKFLDCARNAVRPVDDAMAERAADLILDIESVRDMRALAGLFA
jgi:2-methylcitrate dehydratase PrpD